MSGSDLSEHPLADQRVRALVGLVGATTIAAVAVLFVEPPLTWLLLGLAVVDAVATPYVFGQAIEGQESHDTTGWSGD